MARITVEDCLDQIPNRFELVMVASKRARLLMQSATDPKVPWENDKATVVALREIAKGLVTSHSVNEVEDAEDAFFDVAVPSETITTLEATQEKGEENI